LVNKEGYAFINVINLKIGGSVCMLEKVCEEDVRTNGIEFNITRAQKEFGWTPKIALEDSIKEDIAVGDLR